MDPALLENIEEQRQKLEDNVSQLRKSLQHWQRLELDYEGLKEEFTLLNPSASAEECLRAAHDFKPEVVTEKDLQDLLGDPKSGNRSPRQLADLLSKRVEYVSRNADTVRKQIVGQQKKLNALLLDGIEVPFHQDEAGLPLTDITEELDDSGNVISSKVERPGEGASGLADILEKAGVAELKSDHGVGEIAKDPTSTGATVATSSRASGENSSSPRHSSSSESESEADEEVQRNDVPVRIPIPGENPIPVHVRDTAEEAKMRREMLEYGLNEVGAIVAELDLQEGASDVSYDDDDEEAALMVDSEFDDDEDDEDLSEDETGRVKNPAISERYRHKMEELQKKLGLTDLKNLGPAPDLPPYLQEALDRPPAAEAARKAALARDESSLKKSSRPESAVKKGSKAKKSVAFAEELDIAPETSSNTKSSSSKTTVAGPMGEHVVERSESLEQETPPPPAPAPASKKPTSRFKAARQAAAISQPGTLPTKPPATTKNAGANKQQSVPSKPEPPEDRPLVAPNVLERTANEFPSAPDPNDIDDEMHRREIAMEYHKMRNRRVHAQGGFVRGDPAEDDELDDMLSNNVLEDPETGEVKRVSRFKAARLLR